MIKVQMRYELSHAHIQNVFLSDKANARNMPPMLSPNDNVRNIFALSAKIHPW